MDIIHPPGFFQTVFWEVDCFPFSGMKVPTQFDPLERASFKHGTLKEVTIRAYIQLSRGSQIYKNLGATPKFWAPEATYTEDVQLWTDL